MRVPRGPQLIFFVVAASFWFSMMGYVGWRLLRPSQLSPRARWLARIGIALLAALPPVTMVATRTLSTVPSPNVEPLSWAGFLAMGFGSLLLMLTLAVDSARLVLALLRWLARRFGWELPAPDEDRRRFLLRSVNAGIVGGAGAITAAGLVNALRLPEVVEVEVPVTGLAPGLDGLRIAQLSDIHIGPTIKRGFLEGLVARTNALEADLIAVTGDLIDGLVDQLAHHVEPFGELAAPLGVYVVTGNHEYYWNGPAWCEALRGLGLDVLINEHRTIERDGARLVVDGVTDFRAGRRFPEQQSDPAAALTGAPEDAFRLMLAHQPRSAPACHAAGVDLQLSGHTHGGQYFPMSVMIYLFEPLVAGLSLIRGAARQVRDTWVYVSRGSGYWGPPIRLGAPTEITLLRLKRVAPAE